MQDIGDNPISTFLIDEATYQDLVKRANLADLLADRIIALEQQNKAILGRLEDLEMSTAERIAQDRKRLAKLENPRAPQDTHLLDELYAEMQAIGRKQVDFATAARMVKRSKSRMLQLKAEIGQDKRFVLVTSETHSQKVLIRLR